MTATNTYRAAAERAATKRRATMRARRSNPRVAYTLESAHTAIEAAVSLIRKESAPVVARLKHGRWVLRDEPEFWS